MPSPIWTISLVELIFYCPLLLPILYLLFSSRHNLRGFLSYFALFSFAALQIASSGILVAEAKGGVHTYTTYVGLIIQSVGLMALVIAGMNLLLLA